MSGVLTHSSATPVPAPSLLRTLVGLGVGVALGSPARRATPGRARS